MIEIRFHGAGGHGAVVASKLLADAAAKSGCCSQSFASYGALRRGGKVESYVRISDKPVRPHCKMYEPDCLVVMDESLLEDKQILNGLGANGRLLINSHKPGDRFEALGPFEVFTVDAFRIAKEKGLFLPGGMPVINTTLIGAVSGIYPVIRMADLQSVIQSATPRPKENVDCAKEGYREIVSPQSPAGTGAASRMDSAGTEPFPVYDPQKTGKCNRCQICYIMCPSCAVRFRKNPFELYVEKQFCTRCGICIEECPREAISWGGKVND